MNPLLNIRKNFFDISQAEFAAIAGVSQGTVSRWEAGELQPGHEEMVRIRSEARARGLRWKDSLFFEAERAA